MLHYYTQIFLDTSTTLEVWTLSNYNSSDTVYFIEWTRRFLGGSVSHDSASHGQSPLSHFPQNINNQ